MNKTPFVSGAFGRRCGRRCRYGILSAFVAAFLLRLAVSWEIAHGAFAGSVFHPAATTDLATYMRLAQEICEGTFQGPFYYQPFYYAVFLPLCRLLGHGSVWVVIMVQALLGAGACALAGLAARRVAGRLAGTIAAWLAAVCSILVFYTPFHQIATLQSFNVMLLAYLAVRVMQNQSWRDAGLLGAAAGIGALTRGNVLLVFLPLILLLGFSSPNRKRNWGRAGVALLTYLLVQSPFIVYNSIQLGHLSGPSTAAAAVLALGNTPEAPPGGRNPGLPAGPMEYPQAYHIWMERANEVPMAKQILRYLSEEPAAYLELTFRKLLLFWDYREIPNNVSMAAGEGTTSRIMQILPDPWLILTLGIAGMLLILPEIWRGRRDFLALLIVVIFYWGATAAFYNLSRFRAPVLPVLAVFAGVAPVMIYRAVRRKERQYLIRAVLPTLAIGILLCFGAYEFYRNVLETSVLRMVRPKGTHLLFNDGRVAQFYHGPQTFGGWCALDNPEKTVLTVKFPPVPPRNGFSVQEAILRFAVQPEQDGNLSLSVNGKVAQFALQCGVFQELEIVLPPEAATDTVAIQVLHNSAQAHFLADFQRNYGATSWNGQTIPAELVVRIIR